MESIFRFLKGYLIIQISKQGFVRFLNLCIRDNINVWNVLEQKDFIQLYITLHDFKLIKDAVKKSKVRVKIVRRTGLPFVMVNMRKYIILCVGIPVCLIFLFYQKTHIWTVHTEGTVTVTAEQIEDCLKANGFYAGMPTKNFDSSQTEKMLKETFDTFSWVCATLNGTELTVSVIENTAKSYQSLTQEFPSSLYAAKDGVIHKLVVNSGFSERKYSEEVHAGDLIISGEVPYDNNDGTKSYHLTYASGEYLCEVKIPYYHAVKRTLSKPLYGLWETILPSIHFGGAFLPQFTEKHQSDNSIIIKEYIDLNFISVFDCNIHFISQMKKNYQTQNSEYTITELKEILTKELQYFINDLEDSGAKNIEPQVSFRSNDTEVILSGYVIYLDSTLIRKNISQQTNGRAEHGVSHTYNGT